MEKNAIVRIKRLTETAQIPTYAKHGDSGFDIRADIPQAMVVSPGQRVLINTGLAVEVRESMEIQIRPRSGIAAKSGGTVLNSPGTIDSGYRDEIKIIFANLGSEPITINPQDRIAQGVLCPVIRAHFIETEILGESERGLGGFGHSGVE